MASSGLTKVILRKASKSLVKGYVMPMTKKARLSTVGAGTDSLIFGAVADDSVVKLHLEVIVSEQAVPATIQAAWILDAAYRRKNGSVIQILAPEITSTAGIDPSVAGPSIAVADDGSRNLELTVTGCGTDNALTWAVAWRMDSIGEA